MKPPNVPVKPFWSIVLYDPQTRSELQMDQRFPSLGSQSVGIEKNSVGSYDVYFGPTAPSPQLETPKPGWLFARAIANMMVGVVSR